MPSLTPPRLSWGALPLAFLLASLFDVGGTLIEASRPLGEALLIAAAIMGLWTLMGGLLAGILWGLLALAFPRGELRRHLEALGAWARGAWAARFTPEDQRRASALSGWVAGLAALAAGGFGLTYYLVAYRNGAGLIAGAAVGAAPLVALGALWIGLVARRLARALAPRLPWLIALPTLCMGIIALTSTGIAALILTQRGLLFDLQAVDLLPLLATPLLLPIAARLVGGRRIGLIATLLAVAAVALSVQRDATRWTLAAQAGFSRGLYSQLILASDFDRDGIPWLPRGADCAPFDPEIRPYAVDTPGDGVDQDCDGEDAASPTPDFGPAASGYTPPGSPPNLVLITIDALRADHLGIYGYGRPTSPNIDAWAEGAARFEAAYSADSGTGPSVWSLMVGRTPFQAQLTRLNRFPPSYGPEERTLAGVLKARGYWTEAALCGRSLGKPKANFSQGFERYEEVCRSRKERVAIPIVEHALRRLDALQRRDAPFFLWVHLYDPHRPNFDHAHIDFSGGEGIMGRRMDLYDEEIRFADEHLARLLAALDAAEVPTYVILSADHGQSFGGHGASGHARTLYRDVTRVPLLVKGLGVVPRVIEAPIALNDLYPTLLELAGARVPARCTTRSLAQILHGAEADPARLIFQENAFGRPKRQLRAVVGARHHLIADLTHGTWELYDMEADPEEQEDLYGSGLEAEARLRAGLEAFLTTSRVPAAYTR